MERGESIYGATEFYRPFPEPDKVFASQVAEHSEYLLPVATLALTHLDPAWEGHIHFVIPIEPGPGWGEVGERSSGYHNYLCRTNWIGYRIIANRLQLNCDSRFFHKALFAAHPPTDELGIRELAETPSYYERTRREFALRKAFFHRHGYLPYSLEEVFESAPGQPYQCSLVDNLGGCSVDGNWICTDFPLSKHVSPNELGSDCTVILPKTEDGRDFHAVGFIEMHHYVGDSNGGMLVFFDPESQIVLTTFDWS